MDFVQLSEQIWTNSIEVEFGNSNHWDESTFLKPWFENLDNGNRRGGPPSGPGWYWFSCQMSQDEILEFSSVDPLPLNACDFPSVSSENDNLFNDEQICITPIAS